MPRSVYKAFPPVCTIPPHPPIPFFSITSDDNFEIPDPADIYASRYRQLLPLHPSQHENEIPPSITESTSTNPSTPCEASPLKPLIPPPPLRQMLPLADIGRHTPSYSKRHSRSASNSSNGSSTSRRERQSLPRIEEAPDLIDDDTSSISTSSGGYLSRSDSGASSNYDTHYTICPRLGRSEIAQEYMRMNCREAAIRASMERTSWMIDEEGGRGGGSRDVVEHINYVLSAWQRDR